MPGRRAGPWSLVLAAALGVACGPPAPRPNVLVVVLDTFRADRLAAYGSGRGLTPFLDELAARGAVFERAYAPSSWTSPSVASLLTARHPLQHAVRRFDSLLSDGEMTLAEILRPKGFATAGFSANIRLTEALGYAQGFDAWHTYLADATDDNKVRAARLRREALTWLDARAGKGDARPALLYLQFMDTHSPYDPPEALRERFAPDLDPARIPALNARLHDFRAIDRFSAFSEQEVRWLEALYDAEVTALDAELRGLFADLEARGFLANAIVVVLADHGEEFREHEALLHGHTLYEAAVRVPLLWLGPGIEPGRRIPEPVSLVDVAPTLLALLGVESPRAFEGRSLRPRLAAEADARDAPPADVLLELASEEAAPEAQRHLLGLVRGWRKLVVDPAGRAAVYDLARDPDERAAATTPEGNLDLVAGLLAAREELAERAAGPGVQVMVDDATREQLRALGYAVEDPPLRVPPPARP